MAEIDFIACCCELLCCQIIVLFLIRVHPHKSAADSNVYESGDKAPHSKKETTLSNRFLRSHDFPNTIPDFPEHLGGSNPVDRCHRRTWWRYFETWPVICCCSHSALTRRHRVCFSPHSRITARSLESAARP